MPVLASRDPKDGRDMPVYASLVPWVGIPHPVYASQVPVCRCTSVLPAS